jgi:hypothetical protein
MPKYTNADGINVECSEEQAEFLGLEKSGTAKKAPAKKAPAKKDAGDAGDDADT